MTVNYDRIWSTMNDLEQVISKVVSAREMIDVANDAIVDRDYSRAETMTQAAYEFLGYYLEEFDEKFKLAWNETVKKQPQYQYTATGEKWDLYDEVMKEREYYEYSQSELEKQREIDKKLFACDKDDPSPEYKDAWTSFWEENYYPEEHQQYTEEELNAMCDKAASDEEKEKCREYNLREAEYYDKRVKLDAEHSQHYYDYTRNDSNRENPFTTDIGTVVQNGVTHTEYLKAKAEANSAWNDGWTREYYQKLVDKYEGKKEEKTLNYDEAIAAGWRMTDDGIWMPPQETPKKKWILPVEQVHDDCYVSFPDDLLEAAELKEGDEVNWVDNGDGSYLLRKVTQPLKSDEC